MDAGAVRWSVQQLPLSVQTPATGGLIVSQSDGVGSSVLTWTTGCVVVRPPLRSPEVAVYMKAVRGCAMRGVEVDLLYVALLPPVYVVCKIRQWRAMRTMAEGWHSRLSPRRIHQRKPPS